METADAVIVGGGVVGCVLAFQLARQGVRVRLFERGLLGGESTARCAGGVRQQFSTEINVRLQRLAVRELQGFEEETGGHAGFRQIGYLFALSRPDQASEFRTLLERWHRLGLKEVRWLCPEEIAELVPVVRVDDLVGGTFCPSDGLASPADVTAGYAAAARRHGARLAEGAETVGV